MADPVAQLRTAAEAGDAAEVEAALASGARPNSILDESGRVALHPACKFGHLACVRALLAAGADPNAAAADYIGLTPLHEACFGGSIQCIQALLAAGADPAAVDSYGLSALVVAVICNQVEAAATLLKAAPQLALLREDGELPLVCAVVSERIDAAHCLLQHGALPPAAEVLSVLHAARQRAARQRNSHPGAVLPLYAPLVARQPLTPTEWARVPTPCLGLGAALPAVLARSEAEAALLVARLPAAARERLRTAALCLRRAHCWQRRRRVRLPGDVVRRVLALMAAQ